MRGGWRRHRQEEEEESAFISMTDMTVSFLIIVMILLAFFATQFSDEETVSRSQYERVENRLREVQEDLTAAELRLSELERDIRAAQLREEQLLQELEARDREIDGLLEHIEWLEQRIQQVEVTLLETQRELLEALSGMSELEREIRLARAREEAMRLEIGVKNQEIQRLNERIRQLESQVQELEAIVERFQQYDPLEAYLSRSAEARVRILEGVRERLALDFPDLVVEISNENDALRFRGEGLFAIGESILGQRPLEIVETLADRLDEILPCYTLGQYSQWDANCNPAGAVVEAVQIEGHTDSTGMEVSNLRLSTERANATFIAMLENTPSLTDHRNTRQQPVISVAGYGQMRPVADNETVEGRAQNRRIDLRIIMHTPSRSEEIERILSRLRGEEAP